MGMQVGSAEDGPGALNAEINVTPFVDVMLVLLVIFMITAPMMTTGVDVDLPDTEGVQEVETEGKLILSIGRGNQLFLGATQVKWADLSVKLSKNARVQSEKTLWIEADKDLPYGVVVTAMATARKSGVAKLMMLTDPSAELDLGKLDKATVDVPGASSDEEGDE
jgi:biopolymer transport protein TolR